jgi:hypothetical protein
VCLKGTPRQLQQAILILDADQFHQ